MKKITLLLFVAISYQFSATAQADKFTAAMAATLQQYGQAKDAEVLTAVAAKFERIGDAEKTQWLPYYYAALIKATMSMQGWGGDKDKVADDAQTLLTKAEAIEKNSELYCIESMVATAKMLVDPQGRYMQYMNAMNGSLETAKKTDPTNPRPYMLQSVNLKNTPEQFGGGCSTAKPLAQKALALYEAFKPLSSLHPNWGKERVEAVIADCK